MPKKKSAKRSATTFLKLVSALVEYCKQADETSLSDQQKSWAFEGAIIMLAAGFDRLMLDSLVAAINNDTQTLADSTGVSFPKHLTDEVCEYIVTGGRYVDYRGRDGLIKELKRFLAQDHYLIKIVKKSAYSQALQRLVALRNFAAHGSPQSKRLAMESIGVARLGSAGAWLKKQGRFATLASKLSDLATEIQDSAPF